MGIAFILLGALALGVVVDLVVESDLTGGATGYSLLGSSLSLSEWQVIVGAALLGAASVGLIVLGVGLLRGSWGRRRSLKRRLAELESENAALRSKIHLAAAVRAPQPKPPAEEAEVIRIGEAEDQPEQAHASGRADPASRAG